MVTVGDSNRQLPLMGNSIATKAVAASDWCIGLREGVRSDSRYPAAKVSTNCKIIVSSNLVGNSSNNKPSSTVNNGSGYNGTNNSNTDNVYDDVNRRELLTSTGTKVQELSVPLLPTASLLTPPPAMHKLQYITWLAEERSLADLLNSAVPKEDKDEEDIKRECCKIKIKTTQSHMQMQDIFYCGWNSSS
eukprot:jgi/Psemu1/15188/gm1.15188_g